MSDGDNTLVSTTFSERHVSSLTLITSRAAADAWHQKQHSSGHYPRHLTAPLKVVFNPKLLCLTRAHALAQRDLFFILTVGKITTLSKNWARSSSKLNHDHASNLTEAQAIAPSLAPNHSRAQWRNFFETICPQYCTQMVPFRTTANIQVHRFAPKCSPQQRSKSCYLSIWRQGRPKHHRCQ